MNEEGEADDPVLDQLLERMQRAGWIDAVIRLPVRGEITPQFTKRGRQRFRELQRLINELDRAGPVRFAFQGSQAMLFAFARALPPIPPESKYR